jgi:alcohol dehydrogenase class IV
MATFIVEADTENFIEKDLKIRWAKINQELIDKITEEIKKETIDRLVGLGYISRYDAMRMLGIFVDNTGEDGIDIIKATVQKLKEEIP